MKKFLVGLLALSSLSSYASENLWKLESERMIKATTKAQIEEVIKKYPEVARAGVHISKIKYINVNEMNFVYVAAHTCDVDDPRLKVTYGAWEMCLKDGSCLAPLSMPRLTHGDPCLPDEN
jgi:hypothetical protein